MTKEYHESKYRVLRGHATITVTPTLKEATDYVDAAVAAEKEAKEDKELRTVFNYGTTKLLQKYNNYSIVYKHNTFQIYENNDKGTSDYIASFVRASDAELFVKAAHKEKSGG